LGTVALDARLITISISPFLYLIFPYAVSIATSIRIGQFIGEQKPLDAQRVSNAPFFINFALQTVNRYFPT
jgi:Na+-driven multidrug efflux pump